MYKYRDEYGTQSTRPPVLDPYENLIWMTKPKKNAFILNKVLGMMPLALIWLAFDSFFIAQMANVGGSMMLFTGIFMLLHLMPVWIWLGNVITANRRWKNTVYYVTDKRILIQTAGAEINAAEAAQTGHGITGKLGGHPHGGRLGEQDLGDDGLQTVLGGDGVQISDHDGQQCGGEQADAQQNGQEAKNDPNAQGKFFLIHENTPYYG